MPTYHPQKDEHGHVLELNKPSTPTSLDSWLHSKRLATVVPNSPMPESVNRVAVTAWNDAPTAEAGWNALVADCTFSEPQFDVPPGKKAASGVVVLEPDGRVWLVSPSNQFGGYTNTFPKGTVTGADSLRLRANAIREAHEESGLKVELTGFLVDVARSVSFTRYYIGRRVGGCPSAMGWEAQAVHLVPGPLLQTVATHKNDAPILATLNAHVASQGPIEAAVRDGRHPQPAPAGSVQAPDQCIQAPAGTNMQPHLAPVASVDPGKLYLGDATTVHTFVSSFAHEVMEAYDAFLQGRSPGALVQPKIEGVIRNYGDALMGRDQHYQIAPWQGERLRGKFLAALPAMKGDDDPGEAFFKHYALQCIKGSQALANALPENEAGQHLAEILDDARGRILGVLL